MNKLAHTQQVPPGETGMKGILFKPDMHMAIRENRKTVTRRLAGLKEINQNPDGWKFVYQELGVFYFEPTDKHCIAKMVKSRYLPGETVYIKEAYCYKVDPITAQVSDDEFWYRLANPEVIKVDGDGGQEFTKGGYEASPWLSPLFMPQWAARDFIQIVDVRPERLQEITLQDVIAEGVPTRSDSLNWVASTIGDYAALWDSINAKPSPVYIRNEKGRLVIDHYESYPWEEKRETRTYRGKVWHVIGNPWVWRYEFKPVPAPAGGER